MYYVTCGVGRDENGMKDFVRWWPKREKLAMNDCTKEIGIHIKVKFI